MIATWRMAYEGVVNNFNELSEGVFAGDVLESSINDTENFANFISVGYGGLPNEDGIVQLDAAYMNGSTFEIGAVAGVEGIKNPISVAKKLSHERFNSFRVGKGAQRFAKENDFSLENLLTPYAKQMWKKRSEEVKSNQLSAYDGHDTIGTVVVDVNKQVAAGTSSSGLFMKKDGRIGDSPLPGSGFYADSDIGGAAATGLGEDLMKGILSYEVVRRMGEGLNPMEAAHLTLSSFEEKLIRKYGNAGAMSLICMNNEGEWGVATNVDFTFVVATKECAPTIYTSFKDCDGRTKVDIPSSKWMKEYLEKIKTQAE